MTHQEKQYQLDVINNEFLHFPGDWSGPPIYNHFKLWIKRMYTLTLNNM